MATRSGALHVATTSRRYKGKLYQTHLLRRTYREGGKVKHQTLGNISHLPEDLIDTIRRYLRGELSAAAGTGQFEILRTLPHGHVAAVLATIRQLGLEGLIASRPSVPRTLVTAMIVSRVIAPHWKLATLRGLREQSATSSLFLELGLKLESDAELYSAMDWLLQRQGHIERKLAEKHLRDDSPILYDMSSSYYTGHHCSLAMFAHNRDGANGYPQINYGLLCNAQGCPVAIEVFEGNTADPTTLEAQVQKVRTRFHIERLVLVGDRGMITSKRIEETLRDIQGLDWVTALRAEQIRALVQQGSIQLSLFDTQNLIEVQSPEYPGERLVVCYNPILAQERAGKRQQLLQATQKQLGAVVEATRRAKRRLKGKEKIGVRVGKVLNRYKVGKHFILDISEEGFSYRRDEQKIAAEAKVDGLYVIRTSVAPQELSRESAVRLYKDLSKVERAFRSLKTVDLKVRPIFHWLEGRVRSHVFLCMLAYYVEWHMRLKLQPLLFDDEDTEAAAAGRSSIVAPAVRSESARRKDASKRTADGLTVHSLRTLLADLATLGKNRVRTSGPHGAEFYMLTRPTPLQQRAFELLGASP
jgi:transposase